jgi:hypothetical protein
MGLVSTCVSDEGLAGKPDVEHLKFAADNGHVFVTSDTRIKVRKHERAALMAAGIQVVEVVFPKSYKLWDRFKLLVNKWPDVVSRLRSTDYVVVRANSVRSVREDERRR